MPRPARLRKLPVMHVFHHQHLKGLALDPEREQHYCAIGPPCGVRDFQVWVHMLPPGTHTPLQRHAGSFACLAFSGSGKLLIDGGPVRFQAPCTLVVPPGCDFQIANNSTLPLRVLSVFNAEPTPR